MRTYREFPIRFIRTRLIPPFSHLIFQPCERRASRGEISFSFARYSSTRCCSETHRLPQPDVDNTLHQIRRNSSLVVRSEERGDGRRGRSWRVEGTDLGLIVDDLPRSLPDPTSFDGFLDELDEIDPRERRKTR